MKYEIKIGIIGGDRRFLTVASELAHSGFEVAAYGLGDCLCSSGCADLGITKSASLAGTIIGASAVILPIPYTSDGISLRCPLRGENEAEPDIDSLFSSFYPDQLILGGRFDARISTLAEAHRVRVIDYYTDEKLNILNALPTAEAALAIAINELPITLCGASVHIVGFGRIGKILAHDLSAIGADVTVYARKSTDLAWARIFGYTALSADLLAESEAPFEGASVIFNTVPKIIINHTVLSKLPKGTPIIDLASDGGGVDRPSADEFGIRVIRALSLPGKTAPETSGKIITECIFDILKNEGLMP